MKTAPALAALLLVSPALSGCEIPVSDSIRVMHPLKTGAILPNKLERADPRLEQVAGTPPGSIHQEASIAVFDMIRVCFDVTLRTDEAHRKLATPRSYRASMAVRPVLTTHIVPTFSDDVSPQKERVGEVDLVKGGGRVCFVHGNALDKATQMVILGLDDPEDPNHRLSFRFFLE
jgi:hypothetical protein